VNTAVPHLQSARAAPAGARQLFWDVFFASRGRGVDLHTHCPWLADPAATHCISLTDDGQIVAALALRERSVVGVGRIGLIGLVCVHEAWRGRGLSRQLLDAAVSQARDDGLADLLLWTAKPEVYATLGFEADRQEQFIQVDAPTRASTVPASSGPTPRGPGLPPFATAAWDWATGDASLTTLDGPAGATLADWSGDWDGVFRLIDDALPRHWSVNLPADAPLLRELTRRDYRCAARPGAWQLRLHTGSGPAAPLPPIPLLERV